jgi:hypothetical protein
MDEKLNNQDVLLVKEKDSDKLKVVSGIEKDGQPKSVEPKKENEPQFLRIDKSGNALDNFMSNFQRQYKDPTHFQFFKVPIEKASEIAIKLQEAFKKPDELANKATIDTHKVESTAHEKKQSNNSIDENRVDWSQLERLGVTRETLERTQSLNAMLNWQKSPVLIPITAKFEDTTLRTDARLSFREMPDGKLTLTIHAIRKEPELDRPYFGVRFTDEDKNNLQTTGNLGRIVNAEFKQGEKTPVFISMDRLTYELVAVRTDKLKIPETIKGVSLDDKQKQELSEGKSVYLEGMTSKSGKEFSSYIQVNADKKGIEFRFDQQPGQAQQNEQRQEQQQSGEVRIPKTLLGVELSEKQRSKLQEGQTIYVSGMKDGQGQDFNAYVKVDNENSKLAFFKWNPDKSKAKEVTPDNASKTQVEVNSEGKTNEATKKVDEPLKKDQTQPTEKQTEKQDKKQAEENKQEPEKQEKSRGRKM